MLDYIRSDLFRYYGRCDLLSIIKAYFTDSTFRFQVYLRLGAGKGLLGLLGKILWKFSITGTRIKISPKTKIGYGLYIGHGGPIVVNPTAVIGNNCNLSQFTTIGSNKSKAAVIGDNVYIGPNVCVVENVKIGNNVTIGAGSVVTKDIPDNATAAGNYAKVLNYNNPGRFVNRRWPLNSK